MKQVLVLIILFVFSEYSLAGNNSIKLTLNDLLANQQYQLLNQELATFQKLYQNDFKTEENLITAYTSFERSSSGYESQIDSWIKTTPNSYQPHLAKAYYYYSLAWDARGKRWASETSKQKILNMKSLLIISRKLNNFLMNQLPLII